VKLALVTPRYGEEIMGGAETGARMIAERWVADLGYEAEVFTTAASNHITWENDLEVGTSLLNGVKVHRFATDEGRTSEFFALDGMLRQDPLRAGKQASRRWIELNGPVSNDLVDAVAACRADAVAFYPYLFLSTVDGIKRCKCPKLLHPAAHDEPALYLETFQDVFAAADGIVYHARAERALVERVFRVADRRNLVLGLGIGDDRSTGRHGGELLGIGDRPYVISVGRVDEMKGSKALVAFFRKYKELFGGSLALALVGPVSVDLEDHPDIVVTGVVDEASKWDLLHGASAFLSFSAYESFSLVLMEAWWAGVPALVNGMCEVTRQHCQSSGGGMWFDSFASFVAAMQYLRGHEEARREMGFRGRKYVERWFRWPTLMKRYASFVEELLARSS
jgi:glycosyltransferase involved in cell wall biosynthesis